MIRVRPINASLVLNLCHPCNPGFLSLSLDPQFESLLVLQAFASSNLIQVTFAD